MNWIYFAIGIPIALAFFLWLVWWGMKPIEFEKDGD